MNDRDGRRAARVPIGVVEQRAKDKHRRQPLARRELVIKDGARDENRRELARRCANEQTAQRRHVPTQQRKRLRTRDHGEQQRAAIAQRIKDKDLSDAAAERKADERDEGAGVAMHKRQRRQRLVKGRDQRDAEVGEREDVDVLIREADA